MIPFVISSYSSRRPLPYITSCYLLHSSLYLYLSFLIFVARIFPIQALFTASFLFFPLFIYYSSFNQHPKPSFIRWGTAGIGRSMVETFGQRTKGNANMIVIFGRNRAAAEEILEKLYQSRRIPMSNEEGLDVKLAVHYYSRWAFINGLMPALEKAIDEEEDGKVLSVLAAGHGKGRMDMDDLGLARTFSLGRAASHAATYNDLMVEEFASRHPRLTFIHAYPGVVRTNILSSSDSNALLGGPVLIFLSGSLTLPPERCARRMWAGVVNHTGGSHQLSSTGKSLEVPFHGTLDQRQKLWAHTIKAVGAKSQ